MYICVRFWVSFFACYLSIFFCIITELVKIYLNEAKIANGPDSKWSKQDYKPRVYLLYHYIKIKIRIFFWTYVKKRKFNLNIAFLWKIWDIRIIFKILFVFYVIFSNSNEISKHQIHFFIFIISILLQIEHL